MRLKYCDKGGSRGESRATAWGESPRHQQMNPIYVSTINSTLRNIKAREEFAMKRGFAARVLSSSFMISFTVIQEFIVLLILISANLWKWKLADIKMSNFVPLSQRCTHAYTNFVDMGIRMWCLFSWRDAVNIGIGGAIFQYRTCIQHTITIITHFLVRLVLAAG